MRARKWANKADFHVVGALDVPARQAFSSNHKRFAAGMFSKQMDFVHQK